MRSLPENLAKGQAGVYAVAAQLLLRGITPCFPAVDIGADIVTHEGVRIQVKAGSFRHVERVYPEGAYWFKLSTRAVVKGSAVIKRIPRVFSEECEFVVLWGIDHNRFWIVPAPVLDGRQLVILGPEGRWIDADEDAVCIDARAMPLRSVAKAHGLSLGTVHRIVNGRKPSEKTTLTNTVRGYEGKWEQIDACIDLLRQTPGAVVENEVPAG